MIKLLVQRSKSPVYRPGMIIDHVMLDTDFTYVDGALEYSAIVVRGNSGFPNGKHLRLFLTVDGLSILGATTVSASSITTTTLTLTWTAVPNVSSYTVEQSIGAGAYSAIYTGIATTINVVSLTANTAYNYRVVAAGPNVTSTTSNVIIATTGLLAPTMTASAITATTLTLTWDTITGATGYTIERAVGAGAYTQIFTGNVLTTNVTGLTASTNYNFRITPIGNTPATNNNSVLNVTTTA